MSSNDFGNLIYLVILGAVLVFWVLVQNRGNLSRTFQNAAVWGLIFVGTIAAIGMWGDIRQTVRPSQAVFADSGRVELPRAPDGHYYVTLTINDTPVRFVVDTGASGVVLTADDAGRIGLNAAGLAYFSEAMTANGPVRTAPVTLDSVQLGPFIDKRVGAYVNEGEMEQSLLGMTYLQRFDRLEISGGKMILER
ncbi:TIGR02281 family clan AA aspartic protease [Puniceibacterium sp. IMCC21224]|uniref:retropepsin-like aspartic protease family protein n=1 Tax=Puniceibacterium sp. IMCC21224 TaxID=1618204 RepID=UPI00064DB4DF|nr:TIGR02281 family clan AA aspartic protease [Puniceibacterium sp. IMCC21224]KMK67596.1 clan AA aspartic protease, TIGR02281 family [Puniceibacterium sp. IMCC21224]